MFELFDRTNNFLFQLNKKKLKLIKYNPSEDGQINNVRYHTILINLYLFIYVFPDYFKNSKNY